jgi:small multidrug resistance pump
MVGYWLLLVAAVAAEVSGTLSLRRVTDHLTMSGVALVLVAYAVSFACLGLTLQRVNVGVAYAVWSAVGTAATSIAGVLLFGERMNVQAVAGVTVIVIGVVLLVSSGTVTH